MLVGVSQIINWPGKRPTLNKAIIIITIISYNFNFQDEYFCSQTSVTKMRYLPGEPEKSSNF